MDRTIEKSTLVGVGLVVVLLIGNAALAFRNTRQLVEDAGWVAHTHEVLDLTGDVLRTVVDAETGQRGFLLTGKDEFLEPYQEALAGLDRQVIALKDKTRDNPRQQARIGELEALTAERLALLKQGIDLRRQGAAEAQALVATGRGKAKMDAIRRLVATMEDEEHGLLRDRERQSAAAYRTAVATELVAAALGLALVGVLVFLVRRGLRERGRAAALVREERERLHTTLTSIGDGVIVTDAGGRVTLINRVAQDLTGWTDGAAGRPVEEVFHIVNEQTRRPVESPVAKVIREGAVVGLANHTALLARDGGEVPIDDSGAPVRDANGEIAGVVLVFRDVTERRRMEQLQRDHRDELERQVRERTAELRASEERFRLLVEGTTDYAIVLLDPTGHVASWNPGAERIKGYTAAEIVGRHFSLFYPQDAVDRGWPDHELTLARKDGRFEDEGWRVRKDGSRFWANVVITALHDEAGNLLGFSKITRDLTERKRAEEGARHLAEERAARQAAEAAERQVRASEERLRLFVEHTPAAVAMLDRDMRYLLVSRRRLRDYGLEGQDIIGRNYYEVFPNVSQRWKDVHRRCLAGATERCDEDHFIRPDGQEVWLRWEICPWRDAEGEIGGVIVFSEIITERKRAEEALRQQREWLRVTLASIGDAVITTDTGGRVTFLNPVAESLTGWGRDDARGRPLEDVFAILHEQTRRPVETPVAKVIRDGVIVGLGNHTVLVARDGTERPIDDSAAPIRGADGETVGVVLIFRDVTDQRRGEQALRDSEQRFTRFMDHLPGLAWIKDLRGRYVYANDAAVTAFHVPREDLYGKADDEVFPPDTAAQFRENDRRALGSGTGVQVIETLPGPDGVRRHSIVSKFPILGPDGRAALVGGMAIDVTDRLRAEEALREADRRKDEFLAMLAHELRNPLAPIRNGLHIMRQAGADSAMAGQVREMMERQVQHMTRMVDDLLDVSRITRGKIELRKQAVDLGSGVGRTVEAIRPLVEDRGQTLTVDLPPDPLSLEADPTRLEQVLANLLNNAAKYTDHGGHLRLSARREEGELVLRVRDTGVGIAPHMLARIFDPFVQADRVLHQSQGGLGIGLTLVRRLVEMHGGSVTAHSEGPGRGSEFVVRLPALSPKQPVGAEGPAGEGGGPAGAAAPRCRILVVDDNVDAAESLAMLLRLDGHDVRVAHDGPAALAAVEADPPDLVFLDIGMPVMNGYDVARRLRQRPGLEGLVLVAMTGWGQEEDRQRSRAAGFDHHFVKPVDPEALDRLLAGMRGRPP